MAGAATPAAEDRRARLGTLGIAAVAIGVLVAFVSVVLTRSVPPTATPATPALPVLARGTPAPAFSAARDAGGPAVHVGGPVKRPVVLNFFASWCTNCREDLGALASLARRSPGGVSVLGVDDEDGPGTVVRAELAAVHGDYPIVLDPNGAIMRRYRIDALPATVVLGRDGRVAAEVFGPVSASQLSSAIAPLTRR